MNDGRIRRRNHAVWLGLVLLLLSGLGFFNRWLGLLFLGAAGVVLTFGVWRAFTWPSRLWVRGLAVLGLLLVGSCTSRFTRNNFGGDVASHRLAVNGLNRSYLVHVPATYDGARPLPVVLAFHGFMQSSREFRRLTGLDAVADRESFIAVYPEGYRRSWNDGDDMKPATKQGIDDAVFIRRMLNQLARDYRVDRSRVYGVGLSNGGFLLVRWACELSQEIAAIGIVGAGVYPLWDQDCQPARRTPAMFIVGTDDPALRLLNERFDVAPAKSGALWAAYNGCDVLPEVEHLPDSNDDGTRVVREAYRDCRDSASVVFYRVEAGGHTWPGGTQYLPRFLIGRTSRDLEASATLWDFFRKHEVVQRQAGQVD